MNANLDKEENAAKRDACLRVLELLSSVEGQSAWLEDTSATTSYLQGYVNDDAELPEQVQDCVDEGYVYNLQISSDVIYYYGTEMLSVLNGSCEMEDALEAVDEYCKNGSDDVDYDQSVVGTVTEDLLYENYNTRLEETAIGNLVADAAAELAGTDLAVINGGGIRASLYAGDVYGADLSAVCPYDNKIVVVAATGRVIREMLANGISQTSREDDIPAGRFLQVSGLRYAYRPMTEDAPAELLSVTLADGMPLEDDEIYQIAINDYMAGASGYMENNGDGYTMLNVYSDDVSKAKDVTLVCATGASYADAMMAYFEKHKNSEISAECEGRILVVND
jgi:2',3'-cyclic-nucleotide 2'-phosphodiesterase (5'-nucleotidase family)